MSQEQSDSQLSSFPGKTCSLTSEPVPTTEPYMRPVMGPSSSLADSILDAGIHNLFFKPKRLPPDYQHATQCSQAATIDKATHRTCGLLINHHLAHGISVPGRLKRAAVPSSH